MIAVSQPKFEKKEIIRPCVNAVREEKIIEDNPYERILAREVRNWFDSSQMIGIVHVNSIILEDFFKVQVELFKKGMHIKKYGNSLLKKAIEDSKFECLISLNKNNSFSTAFIFSTEHKNVKSMLNILKKHHQYHLLCGVVENRLMSKKEFTDYANLPDIQIARAQFANVLNLAASQLVQNLESHQASLVNILDAHVRENTKENVESVKKEES